MNLQANGQANNQANSQALNTSITAIDHPSQAAIRKSVQHLWEKECYLAWLEMQKDIACIDMQAA